MLCYSTFPSFQRLFTFYQIFCNAVFYKEENHLFFLNLSTSDSQNSYNVTYQAIGRLLKKIPPSKRYFSYMCIWKNEIFLFLSVCNYLSICLTPPKFKRVREHKVRRCFNESGYENLYRWKKTITSYLKFINSFFECLD